MADKFLNDAEWQKFSKGRDLKEGPLLKALAAINKVKQPADMPDVLDEVEKQAEVLRKAGKGDKELIAFLDGLDKSLDKERKLTKAAIKEAEASEDEEEESPVLLTTKMIPLLRQVKKGDEMQVMVASTGKDVAVLISRRSIAPTRRKLLTEYLGASGGVKIILGTCIFEEKAYTFVVQSQAAGLAKKLKAALLKQTELRLKVRVRGDSPDDIDDDGEEAEDEAPEAENDAQAPTKDEAPTTTPDPLKADFDKQMAAATPTVMAALKAQSPDATKIRALIEFAAEKGKAANYKAALAALDSLEKLLSAPAATAVGATPAAATPQPGGDAGPAFNARLARLMGKVKDAIAAGGSASLKLKLAEAGGLAAKKEFAPANVLLDELEQLLDSTGEAQESEGEDESSNASADAAEWERAFLALEPRYLELLKRNPLDATKLRGVMAHANGKAETKEYKLAIAALATLEQLMEASSKALDAGPGTDDTGEQGYAGIVAYRSSLVAFHTAMSAVKARIDALKKAIPSQLPDEVDLADQVASALGEFNDELMGAVDAAMKRSENKDSPVTRALAASINDYLQQVATNPLIKHVDANVFGVQTDIEDTLTEALTDIRDAMPALR